MKKQFNIHGYFRRKKQIAMIWCTQDVQKVRPDLSKDEAWTVLKEVFRCWSPHYGIKWDTLRDTAEYLYGPAPG
jgi:hypothetical protein